VLVPKAGLLVSLWQNNALTLTLDFAAGIALSDDEAMPLDAHPAVDLLFAPVTHAFRFQIGLRYERDILDWLRSHAQVDFFLLGENSHQHRAPWIVRSHLGIHVAIHEHLHFSLGLMYWNSDQNQIEIDKDAQGYAQITARRSHDFFPTLDLIWLGSL
jgi:hypothetical protein